MLNIQLNTRNKYCLWYSSVRVNPFLVTKATCIPGEKDLVTTNNRGIHSAGGRVKAGGWCLCDGCNILFFRIWLVAYAFIQSLLYYSLRYVITFIEISLIFFGRTWKSVLFVFSPSWFVLSRNRSKITRFYTLKVDTRYSQSTVALFETRNIKLFKLLNLPVDKG